MRVSYGMGGAPPTPPGTSRSATITFLSELISKTLSQMVENAESNLTLRHNRLISWILAMMPH
jgi:hypothetical protein